LNFGGQPTEGYVNNEDDVLIYSEDHPISSQNQKTIRAYSNYNLPLLQNFKIDLDQLDLDNLDESMNQIVRQNDYLPNINIHQAAQRLFMQNRNSTQQLKGVKKIIMDHDM
jgi:hypothetical protein